MITKEYLQQELAKRIDGYKRGVETSTDNIIAEMKSILVLVDALPDYEKKYNEALKRARAAIDVAADKDLVKGVVTTIFPELRESEDERIRKALVWHLKADVDFVSNGVTKAECLAYLDKQKAQKQEWNEEDKRILKGIIGLVDHNQHYNVSNKEMLDWLKSLRPSWKPSEEQMNCLCAAVDAAIRKHNESVSGYKPARVLKSLYEQLKKL